MFELDFLQTQMGLRGSPGMGGGKGSGPTAQQQQLQTEQAVTNSNLNLEENEQRKVMLNAFQGTRAFRGSALSRAIAGNSAGAGAAQAPSGPSAKQQTPAAQAAAGGSLLDFGNGPTGTLAVQGAAAGGEYHRIGQR